MSVVCCSQNFKKHTESHNAFPIILILAVTASLNCTNTAPKPLLCSVTDQQTLLSIRTCMTHDSNCVRINFSPFCLHVQESLNHLIKFSL